jgi:hypothetical protein
MKSCRNCTNSRHDGSFRVDLFCPVIGQRVVQASMSEEENRRADQRCRDLAASCHAYESEGESK